MSRIVVVGIGSPDDGTGMSGLGPGRRTRQFASAIADGGHEAVVLWLSTPNCVRRSVSCTGRSAGGARVEERTMSLSAFAGDLGAETLRSLAADAVVAATVHASSLATRAVPEDVPLWADVFGDPMAEAQAKAAVDGHDLALARYWEALVRALERGDHFSAVSDAQAYALIGQLGLIGRLTDAAAGRDLVAVIPCAAERFAAPFKDWLDGEPLPGDVFLIVFTGSFNTWCDVATMVAGVEAAMDEEPSIHMAITGGAVPGHDERTYADFCARVRGSRHGSRFHILGWVARERLGSLYERADVGLNVERSLYERVLGAENRVVEWMCHEIPAVTTGLSEAGRDLVRRGLAFGTPPGDADAVARVLVGLARDRARVRRAGKNCAVHAEQMCSFAATAKPLVEWCEQPQRAGRSEEKRIRVALASEPRALSGLLEDYLAELPPRELAYRSVRWLWRRFARPNRRSGPRT